MIRKGAGGRDSFELYEQIEQLSALDVE